MLVLSKSPNGAFFVRLDADNEPQPDACLRIEEAIGGQSCIPHSVRREIVAVSGAIAVAKRWN